MSRTLSLFDDPPRPIPPRTPVVKPAGMKLRPYQGEAVDGICEQLESAASTLVVLPTGCGKTVVFAFAAKRFARRGRVMVLAHRQELIDQAAAKLRAITGEPVCIEMADSYADRGKPSRFVVSSIQTQIAGRNGGRMTGFRPGDFSLVIVDEAHHATASTYRKVLAHYRQNPGCRVLGVTATPDRADEEALGQVFDTVAYEYGVLDAIKDGWLVPIQQHRVEVAGLDYSQCRSTAGDLNGADLEAVLKQEEILHGFARPTIDIAAGRKTLVFCAAVHQAERLAEILNRHRDGSAEFVHGGTPKDERRAMIRRYAAGDFPFLVNVGVATEGFDDPGIRVVAIARPTKSRALYSQMVGRGTRPLPGVVDRHPESFARVASIKASAKPAVEIIDYVGNSGRHKLMTTTDILGGNYTDDVVEEAREIVEQQTRETGKPADVGAALEQARAEIQRRRDEERRKRRSIIAEVHYSKTTIDPFDLFDIEPERERGWNRGRPLTDKMRAALERNRVDPDTLTFQQACQVLDAIRKNADRLPCTDGQAKVLRRFGYKPAEHSKAEASEIIDRLAKNGWKR